MTSHPTSSVSSQTVVAQDYGRLAGDFVVGDVYPHPFEITVDSGLAAAFGASFLDAWPVGSSDRLARALHFSGRPVSPQLLMNLALSTSVHDVSQQCIAHLAYVRVDFPKALPLGGTVRGATRVVAVTPTSAGDRAVVHVHTVLTDEHGDRVLDMERKALIPTGQLRQRPATPVLRAGDAAAAQVMGHLPPVPLAQLLAQREWPGAAFDPPLPGRFGDLTPGLVLVHAMGRTVGDSESMQLCMLMRNTHPLHFDEVYCADHSFAKKRVVCGGFVASWVMALASMDVGSHVVWEAQWQGGAHPAPVLIGDTITALTQVLHSEPLNDRYGLVRLRHVGLKNVRPADVLQQHPGLFGSELNKPAAERIADKVFEITRDVVVRR
jgi:2-methylfumaryl-CoA hydratase